MKDQHKISLKQHFRNRPHNESVASRGQLELEMELQAEMETEP